MIRVVLFDLGLTLVDASDQPFPHVAEALRTIQSFKTTDGKTLATALVSDFDLATPPATAAKVRVIFDRYLAILDTTGLRPFFEPVDRRVTLSTHADAFKPEAKVFATALKRLHSNAALQECLFITENEAHVRAVRDTLQMHALQFRSAGAASFDFDDWLQAPAMIAHVMGPGGGVNEEAAIRDHLRATRGFDLSLVERSGSKTAKVSGTLWAPVNVSAGGAANIHAPFTADGEVTRGPRGQISDVRLREPSPSEIDEAAAFVRSLAQRGQLRGPAGLSATDGGIGDETTHHIETDEQGRQKLIRKRFRAV
jgi:hypothetical protein